MARDIAPQSQVLLDRVDRSIDAANALLRALLDISKLDAGGMVPQRSRFALRPFLADLVESFAPVAAQKGLSLRLAGADAVVETDAGMLRPVLQNFLSNAVRYTSTGGVLVAVRKRGNAVRIDTIYTGSRIPLDKQKIIFREFERLGTSNEAGIGLGLAIVERTATLPGLSVQVASEPGKGSRFRLTLPGAAVGNKLAPPAAQPVRATARAGTILIVEDNAESREATQIFVESRGHRAIACAMFAQALAVPEGYEAGLIDFNLGPGPDGLHLIKMLRLQNGATRFVLVTAVGTAKVTLRAKALAIEILAKPAATAELEAWMAGRVTLAAE